MSTNSEEFDCYANNGLLPKGILANNAFKEAFRKAVLASANKLFEKSKRHERASRKTV